MSQLVAGMPAEALLPGAAPPTGAARTAPSYPLAAELLVCRSSAGAESSTAAVPPR